MLFFNIENNILINLLSKFWKDNYYIICYLIMFMCLFFNRKSVGLIILRNDNVWV